MTGAEKILTGLLLLGRACAGGLMIFSGVQLMQGEGLLSDGTIDNTITGVFVVLLGVYCIVQGVVIKLIDILYQEAQRRR